MAKRPSPDPDFAALVEARRSRPPFAGCGEPVRSPFSGRHYVDPEGRRWRRRGTNEAPDPKRMLQLIHDPSVTVLHQYLWDPIQEIAPADRESFWTAAVAKMAASESAQFDGTEYVDDEQHHLLFVFESC